MPTQKELFNLASRGDARALDAYLTAGFDINAVGLHNCTLLHHAAKRKDISMAERLLGNNPKPNIDAPAGYGDTPLHNAAYPSGEQKNRTLMVALLLDHKATINITDDTNDTPLHNAIGSIETITLLLNRGADIDAVNNALHEVDDPKVAAQLLEHGANPFIPYLLGLTANEEQKRLAQLNPTRDYSCIPVIEAHMNRLVGQVIERATAMNAAMSPLSEQHLIPDLANMVNEYHGYKGDIGKVSIDSLSKDPTTEPDPKTKAQLELQQLVLKDVLDAYKQTKKEEREKAASAAQAAPSPAASASSGSAWSARISPRTASAAPSPSSPLDHAMSKSPSSMER